MVLSYGNLDQSMLTGIFTIYPDYRQSTVHRVCRPAHTLHGLAANSVTCSVTR
jgi:hypothetical protein